MTKGKKSNKKAEEKEEPTLTDCGGSRIVKPKPKNI